MKSGETVNGCFLRVVAIMNKMRLHGNKSEDVVVADKILRSLAPKYDFVVYSIKEPHDIDDMSLDKLQSTLLVHKKLIQPDREEHALQVFTQAGKREKGKARKGFKNFQANEKREMLRQIFPEQFQR